jgi:steroid 5-alpha reductase family enzyme
VLTTLWGCRLSGYLAWRNYGKGEDRRYAKMREKHGPRFWWISLLTVFGLQGIIMWIVALPLVVGLHASRQHPDVSLLSLTGVGVWLVGIVFEAVGDWQLAKFKAAPGNKGKVCDHGLWHFTRHPNYFGDFLVWWGHWLVSLASPGQIWTIVSPLVMSVLLMKFSGVGLLESDIEDRRPNYADYKLRTNAFFPWWPEDP